MPVPTHQYVGRCDCGREVSTRIGRSQEHHSGAPNVSVRCRDCGRTCVAERDDTEQYRPWVDDPCWVVSADHPTVQRFPNYRGDNR